MSQSTQSPPVEKASESRAPTHSASGLVAMLKGCTSLRSAYLSGLKYVAEKFNSPFVALRLDVDSGTVKEHVASNNSATKAWSRHCDGMMLSSRYRQNSQAKFFAAKGIKQTFAVLSVPLTNQEDGSIGAMAVVVACDRRDLASALLSELFAITAIIDLQAQASRRPPGARQETSALSKVAAHASLNEFCFTLTNSLKSNIGCDQVALGLVRGKSVKLFCVSGFDDVYPRSPGSQQIQQAMCECLDAGELVCYQAESESDESRVTTGHHLHKQWYASLGASPVASIPLFVAEKCVAVVSLRNPGGNSFSRPLLAKVQELVTPMMPGLLLLERADQTALQRALKETGSFAKSFTQPGSIRRKVFAAVLLVTAAWVIFGKTEYRLAVPCTVQSTDDLQLSAPFEGAIAEAFVRPGDEVTAGQVLVRMDTDALESQRDKLLAELRRANIATLQASTNGNVAEAAESQADRDIAKVRLEVVERKLAEATIRAPSNGIILEGQLEPRLGEIVSLGEPLLRFAPSGRWDVDILVPDSSAAEIQIGQLVNVAVSARPEITNPMRIVLINAESQVEQGQNVFAAEAEFEGSPPKWLRAGMTGVARVEVGRRPVWWVWAHRAIDSVRLQLWKL